MRIHTHTHTHTHTHAHTYICSYVQGDHLVAGVGGESLPWDLGPLAPPDSPDSFVALEEGKVASFDPLGDVLGRSLSSTSTNSLMEHFPDGFYGIGRDEYIASNNRRRARRARSEERRRSS
jgi:hypothetical protein